MTEEEKFETLEKHFGTTVHGWPRIPHERARWWQLKAKATDRLIDEGLAKIGHGPFTPEMSYTFWQQVRIGQDVSEDAGGYVWRCWCAALGLSFRMATCTYNGYVAA